MPPWRFPGDHAGAGVIGVRPRRFDDVPGFALAVQWHPEWKATENEFSMKIFKAFGDACRERAAGRQV